MPVRVVGDGRPGLALVALSVIEQRYRAVMAVLDGARVSEVAPEVGVSRQTAAALSRGRVGRRDGRRVRCRGPSSEPAAPWIVSCGA